MTTLYVFLVHICSNGVGRGQNTASDWRRGEPCLSVVADAHERGADYGVWITQDGLIGEGPSMNIGFVTQEGVFRSPPFEDILAG